MNIYQRINEVRKKVEYLRKSQKVGTYMVVTHDQVTAELRPYLIEFGIVIVPCWVSSTMHNDIIKFKNSCSSRYDALYKFDFVNVDDPKDFATIVIEAHAIDAGDKAPGKAISYAMKYAMLKMFNIETGENEESVIGERIQNTAANQQLFDALLAIAKDEGSEGLEAKWKDLTKEERKSLGEDALKQLKVASYKSPRIEQSVKDAFYAQVIEALENLDDPAIIEIYDGWSNDEILALNGLFNPTQRKAIATARKGENNE